MKKTRSKKVCPGRRTSKKVVELLNKTRNKKNCPGSRKGVEGNGRVEEQHLEDKILCREFTWMSRTHRSEHTADDLETVVVSKSAMSFLLQKEAVRTDLQPFRRETESLAKIWCVRMEDDANQPDRLNTQLRIIKTYLKVRYKLSDLLRLQQNDRMTSNLKRWMEKGAPDKGDLDEDSYRILRQYFLQKEGRLYLNKDGIVACTRREEDKVLHKYNAFRYIKRNFFSVRMIKWATRGSIKCTRGS